MLSRRWTATRRIVKGKRGCFEDKDGGCFEDKDGAWFEDKDGGCFEDKDLLVISAIRKERPRCSRASVRRAAA
jgi:hypothetical protein